MAFFTALFGWLQYKLQWQSIGYLAIYFDTLTVSDYQATDSMRNVQLGAILAANKTLLGYSAITRLGILTFVFFHQFGRLKYRIAGHPLYTKKCKQTELS